MFIPYSSMKEDQHNSSKNISKNSCFMKKPLMPWKRNLLPVEQASAAVPTQKQKEREQGLKTANVAMTFTLFISKKIRELYLKHCECFI